MNSIRETYNSYAEGGDLNSWKKELSELWNEDLSTHGYDYDAYYNSNPTEANIQLQRLKRGLGTHFPDTYKLPEHPTFSDESIYSNENTPGGRWHENYSNSGRWVYEPSEYTRQNINETKEYLRGSGEGYLDGMNIVFPQRRKPNKFDDGGFTLHPDNEIADIGLSFVPFYGAAMDIEDAIKNPTPLNIGMAGLSTVADIFGASLLKGLYKGGKALRTFNKLSKA